MQLVFASLAWRRLKPGRTLGCCHRRKKTTTHKWFSSFFCWAKSQNGTVTAVCQSVGNGHKPSHTHHPEHFTSDRIFCTESKDSVWPTRPVFLNHWHIQDDNRRPLGLFSTIRTAVPEGHIQSWCNSQQKQSGTWRTRTRGGEEEEGCWTTLALAVQSTADRRLLVYYLSVHQSGWMWRPRLPEASRSNTVPTKASGWIHELWSLHSEALNLQVSFCSEA